MLKHLLGVRSTTLRDNSVIRNGLTLRGANVLLVTADEINYSDSQ
jgi:hypothetical protein